MSIKSFFLFEIEAEFSLYYEIIFPTQKNITNIAFIPIKNTKPLSFAAD